MTSLTLVSDAQIPDRTHDVKENVIQQIRSSSSIAPWSSFNAHLPIVGGFTGGEVSAWAATHCHRQQAVLLYCTMLSDTLYHSRWLSFLGPLSLGTIQHIPGTPHKTCCFGDAQSSHLAIAFTIWS